jgi:AraC-like DNA-binding protein
MIGLLEEEKVYKNQNLTISEFASRLNTNRTYLSQIINYTNHTNFSNLINDYRIKEAESQLTKNLKKLTMEAIAFECGFSSKLAFYTGDQEEKRKNPYRIPESLHELLKRKSTRQAFLVTQHVARK